MKIKEHYLKNRNLFIRELINVDQIAIINIVSIVEIYLQVNHGVYTTELN